MRRSVLLLLIPALAAAGCDRRSAGGEQATSAPTPAPDGPAGTPADNSVAAKTLATSPDEAAPAASAPTPAGGTIDRSHAGTPAPAFAAYRGRPVLLNLWATWCGPCVKELPTLDALAAREGDRLRVVTLSQDMDAAKARAFLAGRSLSHLGAYTDPRMQWLPAVTANLPTSILYGADGRERWRVLGDLDWTGPVATKALEEAGTGPATGAR